MQELEERESMQAKVKRRLSNVVSPFAEDTRRRSGKYYQLGANPDDIEVDVPIVDDTDTVLVNEHADLHITNSGSVKNKSGSILNVKSIKDKSVKFFTGKNPTDDKKGESEIIFRTKNL
ncbi:unnamed protein product [Owenia fusiformis]|uniref:Uncharacterized protein n=1 Tax=Owenia fusiformis TaxID=6347 RepID=A0A8J1UGY7_OWEFU|nr:unnamed protein product [Owenia fusiformis]